MKIETPKECELFLNSLRAGGWRDHHQLLIDCFERSLRARLDGTAGDYFENIYHCALYLYLIADPRDSIRIYDAKHSGDFDLGCGMDYQFMLGPGLENVQAHAREVERWDVVDYMEETKSDPDLEDLADWLEFRKGYYEVVA